MDGTEDLKLERLPRHVAIIMDGNGRWAQMRNQSRTQGHIAGVKRVEEAVEFAAALGIEVLTLFTFSTENWNRPSSEISMLMHTLTTVLQQKVKNLINNNIRFQILGRRERIQKAVWDVIDAVAEKTKGNTGLILNLAFNYGARTEIIDAVRAVADSVQKGRLAVDDINEEVFSRYLYTNGLPDPDLLIRTSGEQRISNFLLWQLSYAEFYFTLTMWPDFDRQEFARALMDYQNRQRRFGQVDGPEA